MAKNSSGKNHPVLQQPAKGFILGEPDKDQTFFNFEKHYLEKTFPCFPCETAAEDLEWLIQETLPKFQAINA